MCTALSLKATICKDDCWLQSFLTTSLPVERVSLPDLTDAAGSLREVIERKKNTSLPLLYQVIFVWSHSFLLDLSYCINQDSTLPSCGSCNPLSKLMNCKCWLFFTLMLNVGKLPRCCCQFHTSLRTYFTHGCQNHQAEDRLNAFASVSTKTQFVFHSRVTRYRSEEHTQTRPHQVAADRLKLTEEFSSKLITRSGTCVNTNHIAACK